MEHNSTSNGIAGHQAVGWLGANYWSRTGGPLMWRAYDPQVVDEELRVLRAHGLNVTRSFFYWPDFMPTPTEIDETMVQHYRDFLDRHVAVGMKTIPTFIVGHMSGENWDPSWRGGRDLYGDVWMVARQAWFVREMTARFAGHPAVAAWLISNEMPIYGEPSDAEQISSWAQLMVQAVHAAGATQPVSLGDGAWGIEVSGNDNGFRLRDVAGLVDFLGPHVYRMEDDPVRQHLGAAFICELTGTFGRPVVLEEFGVTSDFVSPENAAHYYRQVLHNTLLAGAAGWLAWNNTDYDNLVDRDPYRHHPFEMHFGLTDSAGQPKPQLAEIREFSGLLERLDVTRCAKPTAQTAIVVSSYLEREYPFTVPEDRELIFDTVRQAYVAAKEADLPVQLAREADGLTTDRVLYIVPATKQLLGPTWYELEELARRGAVVYASYCNGGHDNQRGPWYAHLNAMFGVRQQLRYGLINPIEDDEVVLTFERDLGSLPAGSKLTFTAGGNEHSRSFLPVVPDAAETIAVDGHGRPALVRRRVGEGAVVLCTYPLEYMAAATPWVNPEPTYRIYDGLASMAGVGRDVAVDDPHVLVSEMRRDDGRRFIWFVSQSERAVDVKPHLASGLVLRDEGSDQPLTEVALDPFGVCIAELAVDSRGR